MKGVTATVLATLLIFVSAVSAQQKLKATATAHSVVLTWSAATIPTGAPAVTAYNVYRGTTPGGESSTAFASVGNVLTFTDSTVTAGNQFCYQVTAVNSAGESGKSNEFCGTIPNNVAPNAPTNLTGTVQ